MPPTPLPSAGSRRGRLVLALAVLAAPAARAQDAPDAEALYLANCARCHGEDGSGRGIETLDRPARSFELGGFSFGNTEEAVARTLARGVPGSPMPAFELLGEDQRRALARYVIAFGPEPEAVTDEDTILHATDGAVSVRGLLPPITGGATQVVRGLLAGGPDGLSFEYDLDDLRLLGVRAGDFVRRTDWTGRGGTPLQPLGALVHLEQAGVPDGTFRLVRADGQRIPLHARLVETRQHGDDWSLAASLHEPPAPLVQHEIPHPLSADRGALERFGPLRSHVRERAAAYGTSLGSGFERRFDVRPARDGQLELRLPGGALRERWVDHDTVWSVHADTAPDGHERVLVRGVSGLPADAVADGWARLVAAPGQLSELHVSVRVLLLPEWDAASADALRAERHAEEAGR